MGCALHIPKESDKRHAMQQHATENAAAGETTHRLSLWRLQIHLEVLFLQERKLGGVNGLTENTLHLCPHGFCC